MRFEILDFGFEVLDFSLQLFDDGGKVLDFGGKVLQVSRRVITGWGRGFVLRLSLKGGSWGRRQKKRASLNGVGRVEGQAEGIGAK